MEPIIRHSKPVRIWIFMRQNGGQLFVGCHPQRIEIARLLLQY